MKDARLYEFPCDACKTKNDPQKCNYCKDIQSYIAYKENPQDVYNAVLHRKIEPLDSHSELTTGQETTSEYEYETIITGKKKRHYRITRVWNEDAKGYTQLGTLINRLPKNPDIVHRVIYTNKGRDKDTLVAKVANDLSQERGIPYENALIAIYKTSRACKNPACTSRIPKAEDKRTLFCSDACRKDYSRKHD